MATPGPSHAAPRGAGSRGWTLVPVGTKLEAGEALEVASRHDSDEPASTAGGSALAFPKLHTHADTHGGLRPPQPGVGAALGWEGGICVDSGAGKPPPTSPWNQHFPAANLSDLSTDFTTVGPPSPANHRREPTESTAESGPSPLLPQPGPWPGPRDTGLRRCPSRTWRRPAPAPLPTRSAEWPLSLSLRGPVALLPHGPPSSTPAR